MLTSRFDELWTEGGKPAEWVDRLDITSAEPFHVDDAQDDLKREMALYVSCGYSRSPVH